ncbi:MAG: amidase [Armatimonadota bacterium]|nr:amidase [Armatimonadota bacterium]
MSDLTHRSAVQLARAIREGRTTARAAVEAYLSRIAAVDPQVRAYVTMLTDRARAQAEALDAEARAGRLRGPLHGVPVAVKDLLAVRGVVMRAGSSVLEEVPAAEDATVVRRLEEAGAIVLGTTALHEVALGVTSVNPAGQTPRNPWGLDRITGGSSGGSAAAVAARLAAAAIGSDTGGSIRIPAGYCGIVGLKPTFGRVSRAGALPLAGSFDTVGPMTRTVEDAASLLEAIAGHDPADPASRDHPTEPYLEATRRDPGPVRLGRLAGPFFEDDLDPAVAAALDAALTAALGAGWTVQDVRLQTVADAQAAQVVVLLAEAAAFHAARFPGRWDRYAPDVRALLEQGRATPPEAVAAAREALSRVQAEVADVFARVDVLLGPALPGGAPRAAEVHPDAPSWMEARRRIARFSRLYNATGLPALVLPAGLTSEGLPVGVQLAAPAFGESRLLAAARRLEAALGWTLPVLPESRATT